MIHAKLVDKALSNPLQLALGAGVLIGLVYYLGRKTVTDAGAAVAGIVTGDNFITQNQHDWSGEKVTAYQDKGVLGTVGAAANSASGGAFASWGSSLGGWIYDATHDDYNPNAPVQRAAEVRSKAGALLDFLGFNR